MSLILNLNPIEDTFLIRTTLEIREANYGGSSTLECGPQRAILLRFWVSGIPAGSTVQSVTLALVKNGWANSGTSYLREMTTHTWTEYGATDAMAVLFQTYWACGEYDPYNPQVGFGSGLDYANTNLSTVTGNASDPDGTTYTFPSTSALEALLQNYAGSSAALDICIPIGSGFICDSRQGANPPQLTVTCIMPAPVVTGFSPVSTTSTGTTITIYGENFGSEASTLDNIILLNQGQGSNYALSNKVWVSSQEVKGDVPASAVPGTYRLRVKVDSQTGDSQQTFAFNYSGPSVSSISPDNAKPSQPQTLTIGGSGFYSPVSEVTFVGQLAQGELAAAGYTRVSTTQITAIMPSAMPLGPYRIRVTANGETTISDQEFICVLGPVVW